MVVDDLVTGDAARDGRDAGHDPCGHASAAASPEALVLAADLIVAQHRTAPTETTYRPGRCRQCRTDGCPQRDWALRVLDVTAAPAAAAGG